MGLFAIKSETPKTQYGIENSSAYAEIFGTTGIEDESLKGEETEEYVFQQALNYCSDPRQNYLVQIERGNLSKDDFFRYIKNYLEDEGYEGEVVNRVIKKLETYIWGYYILEEYINDPTISDIRIIDYDRIRLKRNGKRETAPVKFSSREDYVRFVNILCTRNKVTLTDNRNVIHFEDATSNKNARLRFNLTGALINFNRVPMVHIRKALTNKYRLEDLADLKDPMLPKELIPYLRNRARNASGIVFTGKGASGKTTLMNAMLEEINHDKSALVIQESDELFSNHPEMIFQHIVQSSGEGSVEYTLKDLAINGLLIDLDYFIIGEIKGDEAAYFMNAAYTGHQCWSSVHGVNSREALNKLVDYVKYATDYEREDILRMLRFMNTVIFIKNFKIEEISEVVGFNEERGDLDYKMIYKRGEEFHWQK